MPTLFGCFYVETVNKVDWRKRFRWVFAWQTRHARWSSVPLLINKLRRPFPFRFIASVSSRYAIDMAEAVGVIVVVTIGLVTDDVTRTSAPDETNGGGAAWRVGN